MSAASTGHFPGAPFNTDPITTMATSTSEPMTSASGASQVTSQTEPSNPGAPSSVTSQHAPLSVDPKTAASEDPRAASSASNAVPAEPPGSVDPAATSGTSTSTATTTTTTSSSTATTSTTTTTTTTTTTASGRGTPPIPNETIFQETIKRSNNCLFLVRKLRKLQNRINDIYLSGNFSYSNSKLGQQGYRDVSMVLCEILHLYEKLDAISRRLPKVMPPIDNINVMRTLYSQEHTMCHTDINNLLERMIDSGNWNEGNFQIFHYLSELLRVNANRRTNKYPDKQPLPEPIFHSAATTGHAAFENAYNAMKKDIVNKSLGIYPKTLHRTSTSLVVEFLFGCGGGKVVNDTDIVYTMKFLLVERNGSIEYINMIATNELWTTVNNFGTTVVNPFAPSSYEVYRRLTRQANIHLLACFGTHANRWTATTLLQFISLFGKFREVFTTRCRVCRLVLKNFLPPLIFDIRTPTIAAHELCR